ncbi:protein kinase [Catellatospora sp. NPDC049609]|uniref:serine/threonine-protein kinase n=1 Tax=Catellatospora sp. NPDC049609 TaxID=3155505 RepID=UPI003429B999
MSTTADAWHPGTLLDARYVLTSPAGSGGSATVWHARDERLGRMVAVKMLNSRSLADELAVRRLQVEAQALARLRHRHIAEVYDYGVVREHGRTAAAYLVMELIDGVSIRQALVEQPRLPWPQAVTIAAQTADGLAAAHARGVVHRDITASNVLLTAEGAKIIDFGICAPAGSDERDADGYLIGTPAYLAPERVDGQPVQPAADVYSVGVLLYRMLAGSLPWPADTPVGLLTAPRLRPPQPLPPIEGLPDAVAEAVTACLDRDPAARPTAAQLAATLAAEGGDLVSWPVLPAADAGAAETLTHMLPWQPAETAPRTRRRPAVVAAALGVGALVAAGALWAATGTDRGADPAVAGPATPGPPVCEAAFQLRSDAGGRFTAEVTVTNTAEVAREPGRISFDLPGGQRIDEGTPWRQTGRTVTAAEAAALRPGAATTLPVAGSYQRTNPLPTAFRLDGQPCAVTLLGISGAPISPPASGDPTQPVTTPGASGQAPEPQQSPEPSPAGASPSPDEPSPPPASPPPASPTAQAGSGGSPAPGTEGDDDAATITGRGVCPQARGESC